MQNKSVIAMAKGKAHIYGCNLQITEDDCERLKMLALTTPFPLETVVTCFVLTNLRFTKIILNMSITFELNPTQVAEVFRREIENWTKK